MLTSQQISAHIGRELHTLTRSDFWVRNYNPVLHNPCMFTAKATIFVDESQENIYIERFEEIVAAIKNQGLSASYQMAYSTARFGIGDSNGQNVQELSRPARYEILVEGTMDTLTGLKIELLPGMTSDVDNQSSVETAESLVYS